MKATAWAVVGACALWAPACGGGSDGAAPIEQGAAGQGGEGSTGEGGGGPSECLGLADEQGESLVVRVVNDTSRVIYLGEEEKGCASSLGWRFELRNADGKTFGSPGNCQSCKDWTMGGPAGCPTICLTMPALELKAGEQVDLPWDGLVSSRVALPSACVASGVDIAPPEECTHAARAEAGEYTLSIRAGTALKCDEAVAGCRACQPQEDGGCESPELVESLQLEAKLDVALGSGPAFGISGPLELVFTD